MIRIMIALVVVALIITCPKGPHAGQNESLQQAIEQFEAGDLDAARAGLDAVLEADGRNHAALYYLGRVSLDENDLDGAIDRLRMAVEFDENNSIYRTWLGRAYIAKLQGAPFMEKGMLAGRALEQLERAVALDPDNIQARNVLANYYINAPSMAGGSKKKARQQAEEIVKHDAVMGNAILADIHVKDEEYDLAIEKYRQCIEAQPENVHLRYRMGMLYQQLEQWEDAFESFEQVLEIEPGSQGALYQIGRTAAFSGKHIDRAMECLQAYLTMEIRPGYPGYDGAHWRLGMLYEHKGDLARAREEYETARRLNPDEDKYLKSLEELAKE